MTKTVWKYELVSGAVDGIEMKVGAQILHIGTQFDRPMIWALVDPNQNNETRRFMTFGTGHTMPDDMSKLSHVGTWIISGGALVFHTFEVLKQ